MQTLKNKKIKSFKDFTNLYSISKTLRFSLKPYKETAEILETEKEKGNFEKDRKIAEDYKQIKELLDELHSEFISEAMNDFSFEEKELEEFEKKYEDFTKAKKDTDNKNNFNKKQREFDSITKKLEKKISDKFSSHKSEKYKYIENKKNKKSGKEIFLTKKNLLAKEVLNLLKDKYKKDKDKLEIIKSFDNFFTYLSGYNENRDNYYKSENKSGQFATRTIENLIQFLKNKKIFEDKYKKIQKEIEIKNTEIFNLTHFNQLFLHNNIDKYNGTLAGEKKKENNGENANSGINEKINLLRQKNQKNKSNFKSSDFPFFKELYKQIGSIKDKTKSNYIEINSDDELIKELLDFPAYAKDYTLGVRNFYKDFFQNLFDNKYESLSKIYIPKRTGSYLSNLIFNDWEKIAGLYRKGRKDKEGNDIKEKRISFADIKEKMENQESSFDFKQLYKEKLKIGLTKEDTFLDFLKVWEFEINSFFDGFEKEKDAIKVLECEYSKNVKLYKKRIFEKEPIKDDEEKEIRENIKAYLDRVLDIDKAVKHFDLGKDEYKKIGEFEKETLFYDEFDKIFAKHNELRIYTYYNEFRNYITKRNINTEKFKLNFDSGMLLSGFDVNKEMEKFGVIFRKKDKYYLGIINKNKDKKILDKKTHLEIFENNSDFEKMEYKCPGDINKQLPRMSFSNKVKNGKENVGWTQEIQNIRNEYKLFQDNKKDNKDKWKDEFNREKLNKLIEYYQNVLEKHSEKYKETFDLVWKKPSEYKNLGEFNEHISKQSYKVKFTNIDKNYINEKVKNGELYLFQIYNKDFSDKKDKNSTDNLETIYFKELFSDENLNKPLFKLSGEAEMFFRDKIEKHKEKTKLDEKNKKVIDAKRYVKNQILLHLPIVINFGIKDTLRFDNFTNDFITKNTKNINIIGIDRGEKHLLYYSLIDKDGKIKEIQSLNAVDEDGNFIDPSLLEEFEENKKIKWKYKNKNGEEKKATDYQKKLFEIEGKKQEQRKNWQTIEGIKNMKKGYLSLVVKKIADMAIENNAIIVLEDLSLGFKSGRQKIERNIYQQFEKALIDKLNFLVDKKKQNQRHAPQLSAPFVSFEKIKKQTGIVFYVTASYTSKVCPKCNWQRNIYIHFNGIKSTKENYEKHNLKVFYEKNKDRFRFEYIGDDKEKYLVYSDVDRFHWDKKLNKGKGEIVEFANNYKNFDEIKNPLRQKDSITGNLKKLFGDKFVLFDKEEHEGFNLNLDDKDIFKKMVEDNFAKGKSNREKWKSFVFLFNRILEIRNSVNNKNREEDNIICPSCHFDSRKSSLIKDGDANGAYNIAKKGLMIIDRISKNSEKPNLYFKNEEYKKFVKDNKIGIKE